MKKPLIGISSCIMHQGVHFDMFNARPTLFLEQSFTHYFMRNGAIPYLIPPHTKDLSLEEILEPLSGVVFQGGYDMAPESYGESPLRPEWSGDIVRDKYELELYRVAKDRHMPIFGICRGAQLINVAQGGSLYQDNSTQIPGALVHRRADIYEKNRHRVEILPNTKLSSLYKLENGLINSVHHQSIKELGRNLVVEAISPDDGIIEAIRLDEDTYCYGVQWHPEFQSQSENDLLNPDILAKDFLKACLQLEDQESIQD